ncbi:hypothetical protein [Bacillus sp. UNCCL81]|uniref:hypothetical protein n=1 Tax=Bacillus sp. UNCCL81 TaxID=1502755 RepID=UPI0008E276EB|nr:hypothetical protein [Bacillus sp. UNCCL81]SFC95878.1 hypothetical protein SAMN02799633_02146 [Bacillus sp. UNCCL81]
MTQFSKLLKGPYLEELETNECIICGEIVKKGGFWQGNVQLIICTNALCNEKILHLVLDSFYDNGWRNNGGEPLDRLRDWLKIARDVYLKKEELEVMIEKRKFR